MKWAILHDGVGPGLEGLGAALVPVSPGEPPARVAPRLAALRPDALLFLLHERRDGEDLADELTRTTRVDPLNVVLVPQAVLALARRGSADGVAGLARAAMAAAPDARDLSVDHRKQVALEGPLSRRALLTRLRAPRTRLVPRVRGDACVATRGCTACLDACPAGAIARGVAPRSVTASRCVGCGACAASCPAGAIEFPGVDAAALARKAAATMDHAQAPPVLVVGSDEALVALARETPPWPTAVPVLPLRVPCAGAVTAALLLRMVREGARRVVLVPCPEDMSCSRRSVARARREVLAAGDALRAAGVPGERFAVLPEPRALPALLDAPAALPRARDARPLGTFAAEARALGGSGSAWGDHVPAASVSVRAEACTLCALCATACPSGALAVADGEGAKALTFSRDACDGCGLCVRACPEKVVTLRRGLDLAAPATPSRLAAVGVHACRTCGKALPPDPVLARVKARGDAAAWTRLLEHCPACRLLAGGVSR